MSCQMPGQSDIKSARADSVSGAAIGEDDHGKVCGGSFFGFSQNAEEIGLDADLPDLLPDPVLRVDRFHRELLM